MEKKKIIKEAFELPSLKDLLNSAPKEDATGALDKEMKRLKSLAEGNLNKDFKNENMQGGFMGGPGGNSGSKFQGHGSSVNSFVEDLYNNPSAGFRHTTPLEAAEALEISIKRVLKSGAPVNNISFYDEINLELQALGFPAKQPIDIKTAMAALITQ